MCKAFSTFTKCLALSKCLADVPVYIIQVTDVSPLSFLLSWVAKPKHTSGANTFRWNHYPLLRVAPKDSFIMRRDFT